MLTEVILPFLVGLVPGCVALGLYLRHIRPKKLPVRILPIEIDRGETDYDVRIDELTSSGLLRYQLHKASKDPSRRAALKRNPIYATAVEALGWND